MLPSAAELVARFLRANDYQQTLSSFISEANLAPDAGADCSDQVTLETILQEKKTFDVSLNFEKLGVDKEDGWKKPAPSTAHVLENLPTKSNILSIRVLDVLPPGQGQAKQCIVATTADRRLVLADPLSPTFPMAHSYSIQQDSPILDVMTIDDKYLLAASMSGKLVLHDMAADKTLDGRKDHSKYIVKLATWEANGSVIIATAGWDAKVNLYRLENINSQETRLGEPIATLTLSSIPETILFVKGPDTTLPVLLLTRRDSTFLYYYALHTAPGGSMEIFVMGKQNLAPHSNAWVAFSPSDVQLCPTDSSIVAVATSSTPHMKLLVVRLLVPPYPKESSSSTAEAVNSASANVSSGDQVTQASQARAELALQEREEAAILVNVTTMAPQTNYSTPKVVWRPDGSGLYVNSDDGVIRGFEASTGKSIASLVAHEPGSKIRCLWAGFLDGESSTDTTLRKEHLISGGFDQRLIAWSTV